MARLMFEALKKTPDEFVEEFLLPVLHDGHISKLDATYPNKLGEPGGRVINFVNSRGGKIPMQITRTVTGEGKESHAGLWIGKIKVSVSDEDFHNAIKRVGVVNGIHPYSGTNTVTLRIPASAIKHWIDAKLATVDRETINVKISDEPWRRVNNFFALGLFTVYLGNYLQLRSETIGERTFFRRAIDTRPNIVYENGKLVEKILDAMDDRKHKTVGELILRGFDLSAESGKSPPKTAKIAINFLTRMLKETPGRVRDLVWEDIVGGKLVEPEKLRMKLHDTGG